MSDSGIMDTDGPGTKSDSELVALSKAQKTPTHFYQVQAVPQYTVGGIPVQISQQPMQTMTPHKQVQNRSDVRLKQFLRNFSPPHAPHTPFI